MSNKIFKDIFAPKSSFITNVFQLSKTFPVEKDRENCKIQLLLSIPSWFSQIQLC